MLLHRVDELMGELVQFREQVFSEDDDEEDEIEDNDHEDEEQDE
jgi:hypothetical protein